MEQEENDGINDVDDVLNSTVIMGEMRDAVTGGFLTGKRAPFSIMSNALRRFIPFHACANDDDDHSSKRGAEVESRRGTSSNLNHRFFVLFVSEVFL